MEQYACETVYRDYFPFWKDLCGDDREMLCRSSILMHYERGTTIHDGNECTGVIIVKSGCLRVYMLSEEGKEVTLYRLFAGDICILSASCVLQNITFDVFVDAEEDSDCYVVGGCAIANLSERIPSVKIYALEAALDSFSEVMWVMQQILFMSLDKRLAIFMLDEMVKTESDTIRLTHEQIAKYIGSAREVVTRMLKYFASEGIVDVTRKGIFVLDKRKLRALAGE